MKAPNKPRHEQQSDCAPSEDSDEPRHPPSPIRVLAVRSMVSFLHADSEDSDQTGRMPRLIQVFAGRTLTLLVSSCRGSYERDTTATAVPRYWSVPESLSWTCHISSATRTSSRSHGSYLLQIDKPAFYQFNFLLKEHFAVLRPISAPQRPPESCPQC